jgi:hypothetical protein
MRSFANYEAARAIVGAREKDGPHSQSMAANIDRNVAIESVRKQIDAGVDPGSVYIPSGLGHKGTDD